MKMRLPGQYEDGESGLSYNLMRYYDRGVGGYLKKDPYPYLRTTKTFKNLRWQLPRLRPGRSVYGYVS